MTVKTLKEQLESIPDDYTVMFAPPDSEWRIAGGISLEFNCIALIHWQGASNLASDIYKN